MENGPPQPKMLPATTAANPPPRPGYPDCAPRWKACTRRHSCRPRGGRRFPRDAELQRQLFISSGELPTCPPRRWPHTSPKVLLSKIRDQHFSSTWSTSHRLLSSSRRFVRGLPGDDRSRSGRSWSFVRTGAIDDFDVCDDHG